MVPIEATEERITNGGAMAAFLAAGIGSFAVGLFVILDSAGLFTAPALYGPAGGVTGRTTFAVVVWLIAWWMLHHRWKTKQIEARRINIISLALIALGLILTFPPVWTLF